MRLRRQHLFTVALVAAGRGLRDGTPPPQHRPVRESPG